MNRGGEMGIYGRVCVCVFFFLRLQVQDERGEGGREGDDDVLLLSVVRGLGAPWTPPTCSPSNAADKEENSERPPPTARNPTQPRRTSRTLPMAMAAPHLRGSLAAPAPGTTTRWPAPSVAPARRFAPRLPAPSLRRGGGGFNGLSASVASSKPLTICMKAQCTRTPIDRITAPEHTEDEISEPTTVVTALEETDIDQEVAPQQKSAIIHDFCLGIPFGGLLFSMGLVGFLFWRSPVSLTFGVAPGLAILSLGILSLKVWRSGQSSLPFILAQAAVAAAVAWKHCQAYTTTKKLLPWGFYAALSAAMICFYAYVLLAGGNPPPKKKAVPAL